MCMAGIGHRGSHGEWRLPQPCPNTPVTMGLGAPWGTPGPAATAGGLSQGFSGSKQPQVLMWSGSGVPATPSA